MADPLSVTASLLAITTAAVQSAKTLYQTVQRYRGRDKTLRRLQDELIDLMGILEALSKAASSEELIFELLQGPVGRCSEVCQEFNSSMKAFKGKTKTGFLDWTKMEFMRGDINEFIETITGYKSTISVGLGTITMTTSQVTQHVLEEYNEVIQDTTYNLQLQLQRIDEKMTQLTAEHYKASDTDLNDERDVTQQCLRVCEEATSYIQDLSTRASPLLDKSPKSTTQDGMYEAQTQVRQALSEIRDSLMKTSVRLARRLESLVNEDASDTDHERAKLRSDLEVSKQCLDVCSVADEISRERIYRVGEAVADTDSDQMLVTTLADMYDVRKAVSKDGSAQLLGMMTSEDLRYQTEMRYNSRFGAVPARAQPPGRPQSTPETPGDRRPSQMGDRGQLPGIRPRTEKPSSNENRKRASGGDGNRGNP